MTGSSHAVHVTSLSLCVFSPSFSLLGFRHTLRPLHPAEFYLPTDCDNLNSTQVNQIKIDFCELIEFFIEMECRPENAFIQCPSSSAAKLKQ